MRYSIALIVLALAGCKTCPPVVPETLEVVVTKYVPIPAELAADCANEPAKEQTYAEAKRLALKRADYLEECTARMRRIRGLGK